MGMWRRLKNELHRCIPLLRLALISRQESTRPKLERIHSSSIKIESLFRTQLVYVDFKSGHNRSLALSAFPGKKDGDQGSIRNPHVATRGFNVLFVSYLKKRILAQLNKLINTQRQQA
jgi:hypothetical protein